MYTGAQYSASLSCKRIDVGVSVVTNGHCQPLPERLWTIKPFVKTGPTNTILSYCKIPQHYCQQKDRRRKTVLYCNSVEENLHVIQN